MVWYVKIIIVVVAAVLTGEVYRATRHSWRYADKFFLYFPFVAVIFFWLIFNVWMGLIFYIVLSLRRAGIRPNQSEAMGRGFAYYDDIYYLKCTECGYEKPEIIDSSGTHARERGLLGTSVMTRCPRCGNKDVFRLFGGYPPEKIG
ncbi:MAG: hypothetical protein IK126_06230 [Bacteroidales bacterium]|nr:hypothetical protein [Bacteroidales bacterium]